MLKTAERLTKKGFIVLMPFVTKGDGSVDPEMLDDMHRRKILMSSAIVVVSDVTGYYGKSTAGEIDFAHKYGITVQYELVVS